MKIQFKIVKSLAYLHHIEPNIMFSFTLYTYRMTWCNISGKITLKLHLSGRTIKITNFNSIIYL